LVQLGMDLLIIWELFNSLIPEGWGKTKKAFCDYLTPMPLTNEYTKKGEFVI